MPDTSTPGAPSRYAWRISSCCASDIDRLISSFIIWRYLSIQQAGKQLLRLAAVGRTPAVGLSITSCHAEKPSECHDRQDPTRSRHNDSTQPWRSKCRPPLDQSY